MQAKHPAGAQNNVFAADGSNSLLSLPFTVAIYAIGRWCIVLGIRLVVFAIEHVIGGDMQQRAINTMSCFGKIMRTMLVNRISSLLITFGLIHSGISCGVNDQLGLQFLYGIQHLMIIADIQR